MFGRPRTSGWRQRCTFLAEVALAAALLALNLYWSLRHDNTLGDFGSFIASGKAALAGHNPFAVYPGTLHFGTGAHRVNAPNLNPPISIYVFSLLARFDPRTVLNVWYVASMVLMLTSIALLAHAHREHATKE